MWVTAPFLLWEADHRSMPISLSGFQEIVIHIPFSALLEYSNTAGVSDTLSLGMMIYIIVLDTLHLSIFLLLFSQFVMRFAPFVFWVVFF